MSTTSIFSPVKTESELVPRFDTHHLTGDQPQYDSLNQMYYVPPVDSDEKVERILCYWLDTLEGHATWQMTILTLGIGNSVPDWEWKNITKTFNFTYPGTTLKEKRALPSPNGAAGVMWKPDSVDHSPRILLLFGGKEQGTRQASKSCTRQLMAFDIDNHLWWYVDAAQWELLSPRTDACATIVNNHFFVFGGVCPAGRNFVPARSFAIAEYTMDRWRWIVIDREYPNNVPDFGSIGDCILVHGKKKVLLTPGLIGRSENAHFSQDVWLFDVEHHTFEVITAAPSILPKSITLYCHWNGLHPSNNLKLETRHSSGVKIEPDGEPDLGEAKSSTLFAMWKKSEGDIPEIWRLSLSPSTASFQCLGLRSNLEDLEVATNAGVGIQNRCILLGSQEDVNDNWYSTAIEITL